MSRTWAGRRSTEGLAKEVRGPCAMLALSGLPRFLHWAPRGLPLAPGPGCSQSGLRQPSAHLHAAQHGAASALGSGKHPGGRGWVGFGAPVKAHIRLSVCPAQLMPSPHLTEQGLPPAP